MELLRTINTSGLEVRGVGSDTRVREFIISSSSGDAHRTSLPVDKWELDIYNKIGGFFYQHRTGDGFLQPMELDDHLGPAKAYRDGDYLIGKGEFEPSDINPKAERILKKVDFGTMRTTSVGFMPTNVQKPGHWGNEKSGEDPTLFYFDGQELREWSVVHIPSNPDAVKKALEPMDKFMSKIIEEHKSEGFKKDYMWSLKRQMQARLLINNSL